MAVDHGVHAEPGGPSDTLQNNRNGFLQIYGNLLFGESYEIRHSGRRREFLDIRNTDDDAHFNEPCNESCVRRAGYTKAGKSEIAEYEQIVQSRVENDAGYARRHGVDNILGAAQNHPEGGCERCDDEGKGNDAEIGPSQRYDGGIPGE